MQHQGPNRQEITQSKPGPTVLRSAAMMALGTLSSRILGMVREMVLAWLFTRTVSDAFVVAFRLPNLFRRVLGEGSLAATFIPLYVEAREKSPEEALLLKNSIYSMLSILTSVLSVLGILFMNPIVHMMAGGEGFQAIEGKLELTIFMSRVMFGFLFLVTNYAFLMSVANSHKIFFWPAMAPAGFNVILILGAFMPSFYIQGDQLAWSVLLGGVFQLGIVAWPLMQRGFMPRLTSAFRAPRVKEFFKNVMPSMIGMSIAQFLGVLNVYFASELPEGSHSYIYFADRILEIPQSLLSVSLGVALLPTLSEHWARGEKDKMLKMSHRSIRLLLTFTLPCAVLLYVLSEPIVRVIFERGKFLPNETVMTAKVLSIYALILVFTSVHRVMVPIFYAVKNTRLPAINSAVCLVFHFFTASWGTAHYGLEGLVFATLATGVLNLAILMISHQIVIGDVGFFDMVKTIVHLLPALLVLAVVAHYSYAWLSEIAQQISSGQYFELGPFFNAYARWVHQFLIAAALVGALGLSFFVFFVVAHVLRHREAKEIFEMTLKKLLRRRT